MSLFLIRPTIENCKILNILERKFWTHEIPARNNLGPTKYPQKEILDLQITHKKKLWTHEGPTRKKIWKPQNTNEKIFWTDKRSTKARCYDGNRLTRPTMARDLRNLLPSKENWEKWMNNKPRAQINERVLSHISKMKLFFYMVINY